MKRLNKHLFYLLLMVLIASCTDRGRDEIINSEVVHNPNTASGQNTDNDLPVIEFESTEHDFGDILQGEKVSFNFRFTNKGKSDLLITSVSTSCGCTASKYPKIPIRPGEKNFITVVFDSKGRTGIQNKTVTIAANTQPSTIKLQIKAKVAKQK